MSDSGRDHAIVLGASMAGLLAARVLAETYGHVTIVERDDLEPGARNRRGTPQARHIHALLARGQQALEELLPGLAADLEAHGAPVGDMLADARVQFGGHRFARMNAGLALVSVSRPLLEDRVRARVLERARVDLAPAADAAGLRTSPDRRRATGVRLLRRAAASAEEVIEADLVVDATGRGSRAAKWLAGLGCRPPAQEEVRVDVGYVTRRYRLPSGALGGDLVWIQGPSPGRPRGGALARLEDGTWILTLFGMLGDHPPKDETGFAGFARSLRSPDLGDALDGAEPLGDPAGFRFGAATRRRYEAMRDLPGGFLVMGDAMCGLNPIYGQGMTVAALQALALRDHLRDGRSGPARIVHALARAVDVPWELATGADLSMPGVEGTRTRRDRLTSAYVTRLQAAAVHDPTLARAFLRVTGLVDRPQALLRPAVARRVLRPRGRDRRAAALGGA